MTQYITTSKTGNVLVLCIAATVIAAACGKSGGSGTSATTSAAQSTHALQATPTPMPTPTPTVSIIVRNGSIVDTIHVAAPGAQIIVPPGRYAPFALTPSDLQGPITLIADVTGFYTNSAPAPVSIDAGGAAAAITLSGLPVEDAVILDGFTLRGATTAGLVVDGSPSTVIQDCTLEGNQGDGARISGSDGSLAFNNLIYGNSGAGVRVVGTDSVVILNNTLYRNADTGISLGDSAGPAPNAQVENNIINSNKPVGIAVAANSLSGYQGDYNLNSDLYGAGTPVGAHDLNAGMTADPLFILPSASNPDLHLAPSSPAIGAGDPNTPADFVSILQQGSVLEDGTPDCQLITLGYHYPTDQSCNPPTPAATAVQTKKKKKHTPTPTP